MHNQQKVRPKSPYVSKPKLRPSEKPPRQSRLPPSYTSHLQESYQSYQSVDSLKPASPSKSRRPAEPPKPVNFYYFNVNSYFIGKESPKNLTTEPKSNENKDKAQKGNVLYTSYDMVPCGRVLSRHNSTQKTQPSMTNISNQSGKTKTVSQAPEQQSNFAQYIAAVTKKVSNSIALQQHISRKHSSSISPTSPNLPKAIKKQLVGTLSCMRPKNNSQVNFENKSVLYPKPPLEGQKASNAFYENMKSYIQGHMDYHNASGKTSHIANMHENSRDVPVDRPSVGSLGFHVKTSSLYKVQRGQQPQEKKENNQEQNENELQNIRMRQALLRNLVEISTSQTTEAEEKKITESDSPDPVLIPVNGFRNSLQGRPDSQRGKDKSQPVKRWVVSPRIMSGDYSSFMNRTGEQSQTWEAEGVQTNISTTQETPRGLFRKKKMLKNMTTSKKPSESTSKQRYSTSINRASSKGAPSKQENDRSFSRHQLLKDKKDSRTDLWRNDSRGKAPRNEEKLPISSSFVLSFHDGAALEKELTMQQGRLDVVEGWEPELDHATSPLAFEKAEIKDFNSLK